MRQSTSISYFEQLKTIFWLFWLTHVFLPISIQRSLSPFGCVRSPILLISFSVIVRQTTKYSTKNIREKFVRQTMKSFPSQVNKQTNKQTNNAKISTENYTRKSEKDKVKWIDDEANCAKAKILMQVQPSNWHIILNNNSMKVRARCIQMLSQSDRKN